MSKGKLAALITMLSGCLFGINCIPSPLEAIGNINLNTLITQLQQALQQAAGS
jgi:hypothetical protein